MGSGSGTRGAWRTPLGEDRARTTSLPDAIAGLGAALHGSIEARIVGEHSIEVQLPFVHVVAPATRIVALGGRDRDRARCTRGRRPASGCCLRSGERAASRSCSRSAPTWPTTRPRVAAARVTAFLRPAILDTRRRGALPPARHRSRIEPVAGLACGMCGIEPAVVGLAALRAAGATASRLPRRGDVG